MSRIGSAASHLRLVHPAGLDAVDIDREACRITGLTDIGLIVAQLRAAGLTPATIAENLTDILLRAQQIGFAS